jgi:hypothetical protein
MKHSVFLGCAATTALGVLVGVSACGASAPSSHAPPVTPSATAKAGESVKGIPFYRPSTVRSNTGTSAILTSPDPVTKVNDYYISAMNAGGWTTVSKSTSRYHGHLTVKRSGQGGTISVAPSGSGTLITISTYPAG